MGVNRRSRATARWYAHHAGLSQSHTEAALKEMASEGRAVVIGDRAADVYEVNPEEDA